MGNEGSIPANEDEFESQARAPPSSVNPSTPQQQTQQQSQTPGRGGRMMNAVFHRRQQNNTAQHPHPNPSAPPMQPEDMVMMSPEQQQQYYQEQQDLYEQQQQQQYYNQSGYPSNESYNKATNNAVAAATTPSKKPGLNFRPTGRAGAALLNSMKNLSLGGGRNSKNTTTAEEWETKWDEDDESDEEEEEEEGEIQKMPAHPSPVARPGLDMVGVNTVATSPAPSKTKTHLVTATPEQGSLEDGVEWDTGVAATGDDYEKPNVEMFLPLLRVLGKGSFGKVRNIDTALLEAPSVLFLDTFPYKVHDRLKIYRSFWYKSE